METSQKSTWPPTYNLRISKKARHVHLKIIQNQGLEIVVPERQRKWLNVDALLEDKKSWIEQHLATVKITAPQLITELSLNALGQTWRIDYKATDSKQIRYVIGPQQDNTHTLTLYGNITDIGKTHLWLQNWLKKIANQHLLPWLQTLSLRHNLPYNSASIRAQQTLWGSCNSNKNITLNMKLLFVPAAYAEHIMLHELCHTKHLNHSRKFWNLLANLDPNCDMHNQAMRKGDSYVPPIFN